LYSACAVTLVALDTIIVLAYLLAYLRQVGLLHYRYINSMIVTVIIRHCIRYILVLCSSVHHITTRLFLHNIRQQSGDEPHRVSVGSFDCTLLKDSPRPETGDLRTVGRLCDHERLSVPC